MPARSELEMVILGVIAKFGPLTPYAVRKHFAGSPTPHFSSSAGTIYPAVERLEKAGLVRSKKDARGAQKRWQYAATAAGARAHRAWLFEELGADVFRSQPDPLRTRMYFLGLLPRAAQRAFLARAHAELAAEKERVTAYAASYHPTGLTRVSRLAAEGLIDVAAARLRWIERVQAELFGA